MIELLPVWWEATRRAVQDLDSESFTAITGVMLVFFLGFWLLVHTCGRFTKAMHGRKPVPLDALREGDHLVRGQADGTVLRSPLTGQVCVWWETREWELGLQQRRSSDGDDEIETVWNELNRTRSSDTLLVKDGFIGCAVRVAEAEILVPSEERQWLEDQHPARNPNPERTSVTAYGDPKPPSQTVVISNGRITRGKRFRYLERIITPGATVQALGYVSRAAAGEDSSMRWGLGAGGKVPCVVSAVPPEQWLKGMASVARIGRMLMTLLGSGVLVLIWLRWGG